MKSETYTQRLADFVAETRFEELPALAVESTKRIILDTLGCAIGGYTLDRAKLIIDIARELGGKPQASILVTGDRVSCPTAAFANADMANALDADDTFLNFTHFGNVVVADALATAEQVGASGKDLILAVALGFDVAARIGLSHTFVQAVEGDAKVTVGQVNGMGYITIGGAAASGKLLGLDNGRMADAIGIAGSICPSPSAGKLGKSPRWTSQKYAPYMILGYSGALATLLAAKGYSGERTILDGDSGFWRFQGALDCNRDFFTDELGKKWWITETSLKPYPSCRYSHSGLDLFYGIMGEQRLSPEEIESVTVGVNPVFYRFGPVSKSALELDPHDINTPLNLQFSVPYLIALAALGVKPGPEWYTPDKFLDPKVRDFMKKVKIEMDPRSAVELLRAIKEEPTKRFKKCPGYIRVVARGRTFDAQADYLLGDPHSPETTLTDDRLKDKFRAYSYRQLPLPKIEKAIETVYELEKLGNMNDLVELLIQ